MKTSSLLFKIVVGAVLVCGMDPVAWSAGRFGAGGNRFRAAQREKIADRLDLSAEQKAQIKAILREEKENLKELATSLRETRSQLRAVIRSDDSTENDVRAAAAQVAAVEADFAVERQKLARAIKPILTPEQVKKLSRILDRLEMTGDAMFERFEQRLNE